MTSNNIHRTILWIILGMSVATDAEAYGDGDWWDILAGQTRYLENLSVRINSRGQFCDDNEPIPKGSEKLLEL